jgi:hypothetical protein
VHLQLADHEWRRGRIKGGGRRKSEERGKRRKN